MAGRRSLSRSSTGRLFEGQKKTLFIVNEDGPLGQTIKDQAQEIVDAARQEASEIMRHLDADDMDDVLSSINYVIRKGPDGPYAVVGIRDRGEIENYLMRKEEKEQWFSKVMSQVRG